MFKLKRRPSDARIVRLFLAASARLPYIYRERECTALFERVAALARISVEDADHGVWLARIWGESGAKEALALIREREARG